MNLLIALTNTLQKPVLETHEYPLVSSHNGKPF
jgi:hypothetical protein